MKQLYFLEKLLDGVEVEWKKLEQVSIKISSGGTPKTSNYSYYEGDIPWLRTQEVNFADIWDTGKKITELGLRNSSAKMIPKNCVIVAMYGATVGKVGINKIPMSTNQACANIEISHEIVSYRYIFYYLVKQYSYIKSLGSGSQTNINAQIVKNLEVPIPCPNDPKKSLEIQNEIVRILDTFTELTAELTAELDKRKKQYQYYCEKLFHSIEFGQDGHSSSTKKLYFLEKLLDGVEVEWRKLKDVILSTKNIRWQDTDKTYKYIDLTSVNIKTKKIFKTTNIKSTNAPSRAQKKIEESDVIFATTRPTQLRYCLIAGEYSESVASSGYCVLRAKKEIILPKWIMFLISTSRFRQYVERLQTGAAYPSITDKQVKDFLIPIPCPDDPKKSLEIQNEIVNILDKFDTLTQSISEGLPREIELRQQQYEYYREQLFNFPKPVEFG